MGMRTFGYIGAAGLTAALWLPASAHAQEAEQPDYVESLKECQQVAAALDRLTCLDAAANAIIAADRKGDLRILNAEDVRQTRRRLFGFSLPDLNLFSDDRDEASEPDQLEMLESTITAVRYTSQDSFLFRIADGNALWQITNAPMRLGKVEVGDTVAFKRATLGSYFIRIDGKVGVKGKRVE